MARLFAEPFFTAIDGNGEVIGGAKLNFYRSGTTTPLDTFSDSALLATHDNPVLADADGRFPAIYLQPLLYKAILTDDSDVVIKSIDPANDTGADISFVATGHVTSRPLVDHVGDVFNVKGFGAVGDGMTDDTTAIQAAMDVPGEKAVYFPAGTYLGNFTVPSNTTIYGDGKGVTIIKSAAAATVITTANFGTSDVSNVTLRDFTIDGDYLAGEWKAATNTVNQASGYGLKVQGFNVNIDIEILNVPEVGALFEDLVAPIPANAGQIGRVNINGRIYGKEAIIVRGPNDWVLDNIFVGAAGIQKRPEAETTVATSTEYSGDPVDGIVLDGVNIEVGLWHVYACWAGVGVRSRGNVRINGGQIISESNNGQVYFPTGARGAIATVEIRNVSIFHPNWTAATPSYVSPDPRWDGVTIGSSDVHIGKLRVFRTITSINKIVGTNMLVVSGFNNTADVAFFTSVAPAGDAEVGERYSGRIALVSGNHNSLAFNSRFSNGDGVEISGDYNIITGTLNAPKKHGFQVSGNFNQIRGTVAGQTQDTGVGAAFKNTGLSNTWITRVNNNVQDFDPAGGVGPSILDGSGTPEAAVTAVIGSLFLRSDGGASTTLYVKESGSGNTGWVAK